MIRSGLARMMRHLCRSAARFGDSAARVSLWLVPIWSFLALGGISELWAQQDYRLRLPNPNSYTSNSGQTVAAGLPAVPPVIRAQYAPGTSRRPLPHQLAGMPSATQDLEVIQRRSQLVLARVNIVRIAIADPTIVDVVQFSAHEFSIIGLQRGSTTVTLWFENSREPLIYNVTTIRDPSLENQRRIDYGKLEKKLAVLFPDSKVHLIPMSYKIVVKGQARDSEEAAQILSIVRGEAINRLGDLPGPQPGYDPTLDAGYNNNNNNNFNNLASSYIVNMLEIPGEYQLMLHVTIAEINRSQLRNLGVDWNALLNSGRHSIGVSLGGIPSTLTGIFENGEISFLVNWLASNGTAKIHSRPTLTVLSGHSASFLSGGEFPVPTIVGVQGAQGTSTTFRGFGTSLVVTPTVVDGDLIRMRIVPEFSAINAGNGNGGVQGLDTRRAQTTVQLREGQTIAIAGLLSHQTSTEITRIPWFGELPLIGPTLFNSKRATQDETELLILVSPEIVRPMEPDEVPPVPGHEVTHPNDMELYRYAMSEGAPNQGYYQLGPYGSGNDYGTNVGFNYFNQPPSSPIMTPQPTAGMQGPMSWQMQGPYSRYQQPNGSFTPPQQAYPTPATQAPRQFPNQPSQPQLIPTPDPAMPSSQFGPTTRFTPSARSNGIRQTLWGNSGHATGVVPSGHSGPAMRPSYNMSPQYSPGRGMGTNRNYR